MCVCVYVRSIRHEREKDDLTAMAFSFSRISRLRCLRMRGKELHRDFVSHRFLGYNKHVCIYALHIRM